MYILKYQVCTSYKTQQVNFTGPSKYILQDPVGKYYKTKYVHITRPSKLILQDPGRKSYMTKFGNFTRPNKYTLQYCWVKRQKVTLTKDLQVQRVAFSVTLNV